MFVYRKAQTIRMCKSLFLQRNHLLPHSTQHECTLLSVSLSRRLGLSPELWSALARKLCHLCHFLCLWLYQAWATLPYLLFSIMSPPPQDFLLSLLPVARLLWGLLLDKLEASCKLFKTICPLAGVNLNPSSVLFTCTSPMLTLSKWEHSPLNSVSTMERRYSRVSQ